MHSLATIEVDPATVRALDGANMAFSQAYVASDAAAIIAAYAEDAVILTPEGGLYATPERSALSGRRSVSESARWATCCVRRFGRS